MDGTRYCYGVGGLGQGIVMVWLCGWGETRYCYGVVVWTGWDKVLLCCGCVSGVGQGIVMVWLCGRGGTRYCYGVVA